MIFTNLYIDNLYSFKNSNLLLSFVRPPVDSGMMVDEYLDGRDKFYFKKACLISGANATGKTSLGKILLGIQIFVSRNQLNSEYLSICDKTKSGQIIVDFVTPDDFLLHRLHLEIEEKNNTQIISKIKYGRIYIRKDDSCRIATGRLDELFDCGVSDSIKSYYLDSDILGVSSAYESFTKEYFYGGWHYIFSENEEATTTLNDLDFDILSKILKTFDTSIKNVVNLTSNEDEHDINGFAVRFNNGDSPLIGKDGKTTDMNRFSRGTFESIKVAHLLSRIISDRELENNNASFVNSTYFLDEKMAYCHSELEKIVLTLLIDKLPRYGQLFYTTHNYDVLDLRLPPHNYTFTKKNEKGETEFIDAVSLAKKNDRSLKALVRSNYFETDPDSTLLLELLLED